MKFVCLHCQQTLEIDDRRARRPVKCPVCRRVFNVPTTPPKKTGGLGGGSFLLVLVLLAAVGLGYARFRYGESPAQLWARAVTFVETLRHPGGGNAPEPTVPPPATPPADMPTPLPMPTATPTPTPAPDPLAWLAAHREQWPKEITLKTVLAFPVIYEGRQAGSSDVPPGSLVQLVAIDAPANRATVASAAHGNATRTVAVEQTDLLERAQLALAKADATASAPIISSNTMPSTVTDPGLTKRPTPRPNPARTASREEIDATLKTVYTRQGTTFRLFAPGVKSVSVVLYDEVRGNKGRREHPLRQGDNDTWETRVNGELRGKFYCFRLEGPSLDPKREVLDPYAVNSVASSTRARLGELSAPPRPGPALASPTDAVIYEMHVRDFTVAANSGVQNRGLYLGFTEPGTRLEGDPEIRTALDHLVELGVTHVELLPVQDFASDEANPRYDWGYSQMGYFSPEGMYATNPDDDSRVREFKALVDALHTRGIGVIMDVVYNHTAPDASLGAIAPAYYYRRLANGSPANGSGCGNEVRTEAPMARKLILDSLAFWTREYAIDGFRFDLMALIDQETMHQAEHTLRAINPSIILYGEPWAAGSSPLREKTDKGAFRQVPVGAFNDDFRNALKGLPDGSEPGFIQDGSRRDELQKAMQISSWCASPEQSVNYMTCHDNLVLWDKLRASMPNADNSGLVETMKLGYLTLFTAQGVPFIQGGEEFARTKGGNNNSYNAPDSVNEIDWSLKRQYLDLFKYTRDAIALRRMHPVFRLRARSQVESRLRFAGVRDERVLMFTLNGSGIPGETWQRVCVILNSGSVATELLLPPGVWAIAFDESGAVANGNSMSGKISVRAKSGIVLYQH